MGENVKLSIEALPVDAQLNEGAKRQHVPAIVHWTCPACGAEHDRDFSGQHYFSYPEFNTPFKHTLYCPDCDHEVAVTLQINLTLSLVQPVIEEKL